MSRTQEGEAWFAMSWEASRIINGGKLRPHTSDRLWLVTTNTRSHFMSREDKKLTYNLELGTPEQDIGERKHSSSEWQTLGCLIRTKTWAAHFRLVLSTQSPDYDYSHGLPTWKNLPKARNREPLHGAL